MAELSRRQGNDRESVQLNKCVCKKQEAGQNASSLKQKTFENVPRYILNNKTVRELVWHRS